MGVSVDGDGDVDFVADAYLQVAVAVKVHVHAHDQDYVHGEGGRYAKGRPRCPGRLEPSTWARQFRGPGVSRVVEE